MSNYAKDTSVSVEKTKAEIETLLMKFGAQRFGCGWDQTRAVLSFEANDRFIRFELPLPDRSSKEFLMTPAGKYRRTPDEAFKAWEQACRQKWRALFLVIKAKLEAVSCGITTFEQEFLAHTVIPGNGQTFGSFALPLIAESYSSGKPIALLEM